MYNKHADRLATLALKVDVPDKKVDVEAMKRTLSATTAHLVPIDL